METKTASIEEVGRMISYLEAAISSGTATSELLQRIQLRLAAIATAADREFTHGYHMVLELQTLVYGHSNRDEEAAKLLTDAIKQAGGIEHLASRMLRSFAYANGFSDKLDTHKDKEHRPGKKKYAAAFAALLLIVVGIGWLVPEKSESSGTPEVIIAKRELYDKLSAQYGACSSDLAARHSTINTYDIVAVEDYNADYDACEAIRKQQNAAATEYNTMLGL